MVRAAQAVAQDRQPETLLDGEWTQRILAHSDIRIPT